MSQTETSGSTADENFKAAFGHYPIRVELPEPTPDLNSTRGSPGGSSAVSHRHCAQSTDADAHEPEHE